MPNVKSYEDAKEKIQATPRGGFWHNIVSLILQDLAKMYGISEANRLIDELKLPFVKAKEE